MKIAILVLHWMYPILNGMLVGLFAMTIHEWGHLFAAKLLGVRVKSVIFHWKGLCILREEGPPMKNLLISIAGPFVNAVLAFAWCWSPIFGLANACFAFFNILPINGADGERALRCWGQLKEMSKQKELESRSSRATGLIRGSGLAPYSGTSVHPHGE